MKESKQNSPLVSVPVITYNSAKTVIETLESIKAQTYPNIELIISDDCSTDNTVEICREWLKKNKGRFARTELLTVDKNTGVAGNCNRAETVCQAEWVKGVAGDDIMLPHCIQDCMNYIGEHPDTVYVFGRQKAFGADETYCRYVDNFFDYTFFKLPIEEQLHRLVFEGNCVPAAAYCVNIKKAREMGIMNDERIPLLEDWPKWITCLRKGVRFAFVDKDLMLYRVGGISTRKRVNLKVYASSRLFKFYYQFPEWYKLDPNKAVQSIVGEECEVYRMLLEAESEEQITVHQERNQYKEQYEAYYKWYNQIINSKAYRLGKALLRPLKWLKRG